MKQLHIPLLLAALLLATTTIQVESMHKPIWFDRLRHHKATPYILGATAFTGVLGLGGWLLWRYSNYPQLLRPGSYFASTITDVSRLAVIPVQQIYTPKTIDQVRSIISKAQAPISIAGGRFSQGGQIAARDGIVIDISNLDRIISLNVPAKRITVEPGVTWRQIQEAIDPHNLSVKVMQSYNDFTVGGSLSVNVHGRDIAYGPLVDTVESIKVMLADGKIVFASRAENADLFAAAIGGYGAVGVIVEATLTLTTNEKLERHVMYMSLEDYPNYFLEVIKKDPKAVLHNANLYPNEFSHVTSITWSKTDKSLDVERHLQKYRKFYWVSMLEEQLLRRLSFLKLWRPSIELERIQNPLVVWRNYEMSHTVRSLEPLVRFPTTTVLNEYFVPVNQLVPFVKGLRDIVNRNNVNMINVSIRYVPKNTDTLLTYAPQDSFALVCYINIPNVSKKFDFSQVWTQQLIDLAVSLGGTYYLPYQLHATPEQLHKAYPRFDEFVAVKKKYDPRDAFSNELLKKYI